ncbi:MAG: zinc-ribbon domain-containing protein [Myxococcales bacterium]|nr:zinc-ribbon domain-containing protein [Myxococcales bacterium]
MNLSCSNCGARYSIGDDKVRGKGKTFRIKCKKCATPIVVQGLDGGTDAGKSAAQKNGLSSVPDDGWYMVVDGEQIGPVTKDVLIAHVEQGDANADTFVWRQGYADWRRFGDVEGFQDVVAAIGSATADVRSLTSDDMVTDDLDDHDPTFVQYTLPEEVQRELAQRSVISVVTPTVDETARTTVVPMESFADMRPGAASTQTTKLQDDKQSAAATLSSLFSDEDDEPQAARPAAQDSGGGGFFAVDDKSQQSEKTMLHQRRESSVLFSLDELDTKKKQQASGSAAEHTSDSGLIDIRAVARRESKAKASLQTAGDLFGDFGAASAASETEGAFDTRLKEGAAAPIIIKKKSNGPLYGVIALLVLLVAGAAVFFFVIQPQQREAELAVAEANRAKAESEAEAARKAAELTARQEEAQKLAETAAKTAEAARLEAEAAKKVAEEQMKKMAADQAAAAAAAAAAKQPPEMAAETAQPTPTEQGKTPEQTTAKQDRQGKVDTKKAEVKDKATEMKDVVQKTANQPPQDTPKVVQKTSQEATAANALLAGLNSAQKNPAPTPTNASPEVADSGSSLPKDLKSSDVRKVVRNYSGKVINCYKNHGGGADGAAVVSTRVTVSGSGNVTNASVTSGGNAQMVNCIEGALRGMKFPQFQDASQTIDIPFRVN